MIIPKNVQAKVEQYHKEQKKIVLVTGVFDLLHQEHILFLQKAKNVGDVLIVAIESDVRVKVLKGEGRPIWNQERRLKVLKETGVPDLVFILPEDFAQTHQHEQLITEIRPAILAVSSHSPHLDKKRKLVEKHGGKVMIVHDHNPNISTTKLIKERL